MAGWDVDIFMYTDIPVVLPDVAAKFATKYQAYKQKKRIDTRYINTCIARYIKLIFDNNYIHKINEEDECKKEGTSSPAKSLSYNVDMFQVPQAIFNNVWLYYGAEICGGQRIETSIYMNTYINVRVLVCLTP